MFTMLPGRRRIRYTVACYLTPTLGFETTMTSRVFSRLGLHLAVLFIGVSAMSAQGFRSDDPVLRAMWQEGMEQSQTEALAQILMDYIGPRLSGTPNFHAAVDWLEETYRDWGVDVRREQYGTWRGWRQGILHVDLIEPRVQTLETHLLAWSPGTDGSGGR